MERSSENALSMIRELFDLAQALAPLDLVVATLHCNWSSFGSWMMVIEKGARADKSGAAFLTGDHDAMGPDAIWFNWDGKDEVLLVKSQSAKPLCEPGRWQTVLDQGFENSSAAIEFVANYARRWGLQS